MPLPSPLISHSPEIMSGTVVFTGTRVPVQTLLDSVSREHAIAVLELAKEATAT